MEAAGFVRLRAAYVHRYSGFDPSITRYSFQRRQCQCDTDLTLASTVPATGLTCCYQKNKTWLTCNFWSQIESIDDDAHTKIFGTDSLSLLNIRDAQMVNELQPFCSEYAFMFYQLLVEVRWFLQLSKSPEIKEVPTFSQETRTFLENIIHEFDVNEAYEIKKIKEVTNHDVKAVVHYLKLKCKSHPEVSKALDFFHFGCTSEDIHNLACSLLVKNAMNHVMFPVMNDLCKALYTMGKDNLHVPMSPHIHQQLALPTTLGKRMAICAFRLDNWAQHMTEVSIFGEFAGVVGKCNEQNIMYPEIVWTQIAEELVTSLGLQYNPVATKIGSHHYMVELFDNMLNFNNVLLDFTKDVWSYISLGYFKQMTKGGQVGSFTMPHEVDPTNFGNCRSNLLMAKAAIAAVSMNVSTCKRDVTNVLLRFTWLGLTHSLAAYKKSLHGIKMLQVNESQLSEDLEKNWVVFAETIQTVMRRYAVPEPYETLKELTRGDVDTQSITIFIRNLDLPEEEKLNLLNMIPHSYTREAENLARSIDEALGSLSVFKIK